VIDFRYHAISMVAVFLALAIGIVLGVTIGDSLVSEAEQGLRQSLQEDVVEARSASEDASAELEARDQLLEEALPILAGRRLAGERIAVVTVGSLPDELESSIREAIEVAGGDVDSVSDLPTPPDIEELADAVGGRLANADRTAARADELARRVARAMVEGGELARRLGEELPERFVGDYRGADAVVFHRAPVAEEDTSLERFAAATGGTLLRAAGIVVGVEAADADPSQIPFYQRLEITTVDSADTPGGQAALVFALMGSEGDFGFKETADDVLPEPPRDTAEVRGGRGR
jgi:hypothetical protein